MFVREFQLANALYVWNKQLCWTFSTSTLEILKITCIFFSTANGNITNLPKSFMWWRLDEFTVSSRHNDISTYCSIRSKCSIPSIMCSIRFRTHYTLTSQKYNFRCHVEQHGLILSVATCYTGLQKINTPTQNCISLPTFFIYSTPYCKQWLDYARKNEVADFRLLPVVLEATHALVPENM